MMDFPHNLDDFDNLARFLVLFTSGHGGAVQGNMHNPSTGDNILQETGTDFILQETGDFILQEG